MPKRVYSARTFGLTGPATLFHCIFSPFCQHAVYATLDSHRYKGKNTHELIVLPAIRQVLPADPAMRQNRLLGGMLWLRGSVAVYYLPTAKAASPASRNLSWRGGYPSEPWPRDLELAFDPDQNIHGRQDAKRLPEDLTAR